MSRTGVTAGVIEWPDPERPSRPTPELTVDDPPAELDDEEGDAGGRSARERFALVAFVVAAVVAVAWSFWAGRYSWFSIDDWDFFTRGSSLDDLFRSHHGHWTTLPLLVYRGLYAVDGLHHYQLYQALAITCHVGAAALLRVVMRRADVDPWIATAAAAVFLFFGAGRDNIVNGFMVTLTAALLFGLVAILLTGHDGPIDRRDWAALAAGAAALMCSGLGMVMVLTVVLATFVRRGWRPALLQLVPLAALQVTWTLATDGGQANKAGRPTVSIWSRWVWDAVSGVFSGLGHFTVVGVALGVLLVVGLALAWGGLPVAQLRRQAAAPAALLVGGVAFFVLTAYGRWNVPGSVRAERYLDIGAALALPALAVAVDAMARRSRLAAPVAVGLLVVGIPWNIQAMVPTRLERNWYSIPKQVLLAAPRSPLAPQVPPGVRPLARIWTDGVVTLGWLQAAERAGKLPEPPRMPGSAKADLVIRLGVSQTNGRPGRQCTSHAGPTEVTTVKGDTVNLAHPLTVTAVDPAGETSRPVVFDPSEGRLLTFELDGVSLRLDPGSRDGPVEICR